MQTAFYMLEGIVKRNTIHVIGLKLGNSRRNEGNMLQFPHDKIMTSLSVNAFSQAGAEVCLRKANAYGISVATCILQILNSVSKCRFEL